MRIPSHHLPNGLPPVIGPGARVLILGSFPSALSLTAGEYYANPKNQFWKVMGALFAIDPALPYRKRLSLLGSRGVALWDAIASCDRERSADSTITGARCNPLGNLLAEHPGIRLVACNGSAAARFVGTRPVLPVRVLQLPSTSPAYARMALGEKIRVWSAICGFLDG